jgi:ABC-2 type transport system permease protein
MTKLLAFLQRDLRIALSYRVSFVASMVTILLGLTSMNFVSTFVNSGSTPALESYGADYFAYALVGLSVVIFVQAFAGLFPGAIRAAQQTGTLEVMMGSRTSFRTVLTGSVLYGLAFALLRLVVVLALGAFVFGANLSLAQAPTAVLAFALTAAAFAGLGIAGAAFVLLFKQAEPFTGGLISLSLLLSGILYPTSVLPAWLQEVAGFLPLTHTSEALRVTLIEGAAGGSVLTELGILAGFALLLPASLVVFSLAITSAKMDGSLGHY